MEAKTTTVYAGLKLVRWMEGRSQRWVGFFYIRISNSTW